MGCCCSSIENRIIEGPPDQFPRCAPPVEHLLINKVVKNRYKITFGTRVCYKSNTELAYPDLAAQYNLGYRFLEFLAFPYQLVASGFRTTREVYQGIFYKDTEDEPGSWQLHVEPSSHETESTFSTERWRRKQTTTYNMQDMFAKITELTRNGARYLGLTQTGMDTKVHGFMNPKIKGVINVDLLFEIPVGPPKDTYVYRTLSQQVNTKWGVNGTYVKCEFDYKTVVENHVAEGWRLITAFMDTGAMNLAEQRQRKVSRTQIECLYVFEKQASRLHDNVRQYEVKVVEFPYKLVTDCCNVVPGSIWDATIENMGRQGWYITAILPTPRLNSGACSMTNMVLMFFQRKIC